MIEVFRGPVGQSEDKASTCTTLAFALLIARTGVRRGLAHEYWARVEGWEIPLDSHQPGAGILGPQAPAPHTDPVE
jgi:hypothetical protein